MRLRGRKGPCSSISHYASSFAHIEVGSGKGKEEVRRLGIHCNCLLPSGLIYQGTLAQYLLLHLIVILKKYSSRTHFSFSCINSQSGKSTRIVYCVSVLSRRGAFPIKSNSYLQQLQPNRKTCLKLLTPSSCFNFTPKHTISYKPSSSSCKIITIAKMRFSTISMLALPLLAAATESESPIDQAKAQAQYWFDKISSYIPKPSAQHPIQGEFRISLMQSAISGIR
jgi:hypothetical protein